MPALKKIEEEVEIKLLKEPAFSSENKSKMKGIFYHLTNIFREEKNKLIFKRSNMFRKITASILTVVLLLTQGPFSFAVLAQSLDAPSAPSTLENSFSAPTPPPEPTAPISEQVSPTPPPEPTAPEAPTVEEILNPSPTPTPEPEQVVAEDLDTDSHSNTFPTNDSSSSDGEGATASGVVADGQTGSAVVDTGDATNTAVISTDLNNNTSVISGAGIGGAQIVNSGNGSESTNTGSATLSDTNNTIQDNTANVINNLNQTTVTGDNSASKNVGDAEISTGDANTSGTLITNVNTNVDGVAVYEFNVVDDHSGDIVLDLTPTNCISGCNAENFSVVNTQNGTDSENTGTVADSTTNNIFQNNDANIDNNMTLLSDSGDNTADKNTNGDSTVETGDANVSANVLNFANNNIAGGVIYTVVNVFGDLVGDIILPESSLTTCCGGSTTVANTGNGSDSQNTAGVSQTTTDTTFQYNDATIENNLVLDANTGANDVSKNTGGDSSVESGDVNLVAQAVNIANMNLVAGNYWLVIVNEAGKWIGKILGSPDGSNLAGSNEFEFVVNDAGEIVVVNSGNGSDSTNLGSVTSESNNTIVQTNDANIVNNINLTANTGGNSASANTGGNSSIVTGDANIVANIVNFVNNNIVGSGKLFVTVVNVFGSWLGDFVGPGQIKEDDLADNNPNPGLGGSSDGSGSGSNSSSNSQSSSSDGSGSSSSNSQILLLNTPTSKIKKLGNVLASAQIGGNSDLASDTNGALNEESGKKVLKINLAWALLGIPFILLYLGVKRRAALAKLLSKKKN